MPLGPKDPARSLMPAWTRAARSYAAGSRLRSTGKEACSPGGVETREDRDSRASFLLLVLLSYSRKRAQEAVRRRASSSERTRRGMRERAGAVIPLGTKPLSASNGLFAELSATRTECLRARRRPANWRCATTKGPARSELIPLRVRSLEPPLPHSTSRLLQRKASAGALARAPTPSHLFNSPAPPA
jgi:hypothetical protein